jgi:hypothetical protein
MALNPEQWKKDPAAVLDWDFDWSAWLLQLEVIVASEFIVDAGLTVDFSSFTGDSATVWLSGGTPGTTYEVTNRVTTSAGRTDDRTLKVRVVEQGGAVFEKDPEANLDYSFDWSGWLRQGEEITSSVFASSLGIEITTEESFATHATAWVSGGEAMQPYRLSNRITTTEGRTDRRYIIIRVKQR